MNQILPAQIDVLALTHQLGELRQEVAPTPRQQIRRDAVRGTVTIVGFAAVFLTIIGLCALAAGSFKGEGIIGLIAIPITIFSVIIGIILIALLASVVVEISYSSRESISTTTARSIHADAPTMDILSRYLFKQLPGPFRRWERPLVRSPSGQNTQLLALKLPEARKP